MTTGYGLRRCIIPECRKAFYPKREWQKTCSPECSKEHNAREANKRQKRQRALNKSQRALVATIGDIDAPLEPINPREMNMDGVFNLCAALFDGAHREHDYEWFESDLARFIIESVDMQV